MWQKQHDVQGNQFDIDLGVLSLPNHPDPAAVQARCDQLLSVQHLKEPTMYQPFTAFLTDYLSTTEFIVMDTNKTYYLDGYAPDITVSMPGVAIADAMSMVLFIELKSQDPSTALSCDKNLGQVYEYLLAAARCQQERCKFAGILSNFGHNIAVVLTRIEGRVYLTHYLGATMPQLLRFITWVLGEPDFHPPRLGFSDEIGPMLNRLGHVSHSVVGEFRLRERFPHDVIVAAGPFPAYLIKTSLSRPRMAVKRSKRNIGTLDDEIAVLLEIRRLGGHPNLPYIMHLADDNCEFGILPIGISITSRTISVPGMGARIVQDILSALYYLHSHEIIHRDVRRANVVLHGSSAVLIDFDAATTAGRRTSHLGGCICIPEVVLHNPGHNYIPTAAHDLLAVVLLVNSLLFPDAYRGFTSMNVIRSQSTERDRLIALWASLRASPIWGPLVGFAENEQVQELCEGLQAMLIPL